VHGTLTREGVTSVATKQEVERYLSDGRFFYLDLDDADEQDHDAADLLANSFHFHPLTVVSAEQFGQRPKLDEYDDYAYMVAHGAQEDGTGTIEIHMFFSDKYVVTVRRGPCPALDEVRRRVGTHRASETASPQIVLVYLIVDTLTDSFFPVLSALDGRIDELEDDILEQPTEAQLGELFEMKRHLVAIRKVVSPQRDMFAGLSSGVTELSGTTDESSRYFRDLYDHLIRISDMVDNYRDLLSGVMDTHVSTVSNRLNVVMKQLTIIATIFLPLSFLTGFFGQNFATLVSNIQGWPSFVGIGIGLQVATVIVLLLLFKRRGWMGGPSA
jgi:magnesium transporter